MENFIQGFIDPIVGIIPKIPNALLILALGIIFIKIIITFLDRFLSLKVIKLPNGLKGILISVVKLFLWVFLFIFMISNLGFSNLALAISGSTAIFIFFLSSGASGLISDTISGIFLVGDPDFNVGDKVKAGEKDTEGIIYDMDMRKTRIKDKNGEIHVIPNSLIEKKEWVVLERHKGRRKELNKQNYD